MAGSESAVDEMTTAEAAFVLGVDQNKVKKACANRVIEARVRGAARKLEYGDVVFLRYYLTHPDLSADQRATLYRNVKLGNAKLYQPSRKVFRPSRVAGKRKPARMLIAASQDGTMVVDLAPTIAEVSERAAELMRLRDAVKDGTNGEPRLRGADVPVYRVAALVLATQDGEVDTAEARKGFPSLSEEQIVTAYRYSLAYPKKGRPYPSRSLKSMLDEIEFPEISDDGQGDE